MCNCGTFFVRILKEELTMSTKTWEEVKVQYDSLVNIFDQTRNIADLYNAMVYVTNYYMSNRSCLPAAYQVAWCHYAGMVYDAKFADSEIAISLLQYIYKKGYTDAAFLLSKIYSNLKNYTECFRWTKIVVNDDPNALNSHIRLATYYSEGKGTEQDLYAADQIFEDMIEKSKDDYEFAESYAEHLLRKHSIESFYWMKKASNMAPDLYLFGACLHAIVNIALEFNDLKTAIAYSEKINRLIGTANDSETDAFIRESYYLSFNEIEIYKGEHGIK